MTDIAIFSNRDLVPLWLPAVMTGFLLVLIPVYWRRYGPENFLWASDIALFGIVVALWIESSLIASMMTIAVVLPEIWWNVCYFTRLFTGKGAPGDLAAYMFDRRYSVFLRSLSLFHVFLPPVLLWAVWRLGYDPRALIGQTILAWVALPLTRWVEPKDNINWVYGFGQARKRWLGPWGHVALLMGLFPLLIYLPTHAILSFLLG